MSDLEVYLIVGVSFALGCGFFLVYAGIQIRKWGKK